tara:strand:+ start:718 stop:966 length:249 start_codon:yes stop_codon:yes gene_type:complete
MPRNKISDLNNHLFSQLEKLNDDELTGEQLDNEVQRAKAMSNLAGQIISSTKLTLDAIKMAHKGDINFNDIPNMLNQKNDET